MKIYSNSVDIVNKIKFNTFFIIFKINIFPVFYLKLRFFLIIPAGIRKNFFNKR